ncbi:UDP-glucose 4-epimerase family protein [Pseudomonas gingeri]|uniref:UDP-glucose 4-epimerase family protein n=1 Tax=Pseudomonas gingeri TaxID=117681 RepID=UPI0015A1D694|nr:SDR family oxidoreductase [Pseudomonas gingeri]NWA04473.1 SDR family oxidoreductase [Pseudomonas gingeri]NWA15550.1 SDR family oxidoreductase [Pseudomonas gingeri]NWA58278.1 SDR family oxidoreductase [Pseudomonas gingeri]NWA96046.1 SDR family oxidoreductase [Pseudomonas gingeri]NWB04580.1 SDR family oxidoreductase [Pseudomonas gingeri]
MPSIFLTGGTGFVGGAVLRRLSSDTRSSYRLMVGVRRPGAQFPEGVVPVVGGRDDIFSAGSYLSEIDVVIHAAARVHVMNETAGDVLEAFRQVNTEATLALARKAAQAGVKRFVFISSIKVNGEGTLPGRPYRADDLPSPTDPYGISKLEAERGLQALSAETGMEVVIIRPVLVYGPGVKANFRGMMNWLRRGVPLPFGAINNQRSLVALDNLVDLIVACIDHPAAANQVFLVSDGEDLSTTQLLIRMGHALGRPARLLPAPMCFLSILFRLLGKKATAQRLLGSLQVDIDKTRTLLNWVPPVNVEDALSATAKDYLESCVG